MFKYSTFGCCLHHRVVIVTSFEGYFSTTRWCHYTPMGAGTASILASLIIIVQGSHGGGLTIIMKEESVKASHSY